MPSETTIKRRLAKTQWLREHPTHHAWLRSKLPGTWKYWRRDPVAADIVRSLKACGIYSELTGSVDICATMRRLAVELTVGSLPPTEQAVAEIEVILNREGVDRAAIIRQIKI